MTIHGTQSIRLHLWFWGLMLATATGLPADRVVVREYSTVVSEESAAQREQRQRVLAGRRSGPVVLVHRGASATAPENSLAAYAAALDYGADGCEVDVRRTQDGVLVLFHDDGLDRVTAGFGRVREVSFRELEMLPPQTANGRPLFAPPPTFAALLEVARQRGMLLHLDLKEPGLEQDVARLLDEAEAWDHVVYVNAPNAAELRRDPRLHLLTYKAPGLYQGRRDLDPSAIAAALAQPGELILVDDPRVAALVLRRPPYQPQPYTRVQRLAVLPPLPTSPPAGQELPALALTRALAAQPEAGATSWLIGLISGRNSAATGQQRLIERAWAAERLGELGRKSGPVVNALLDQARQPSEHPDWVYHSLDAAMAIRALGKLKATEATRDLLHLLRRANAHPSVRAGETSEVDETTSENEWSDARLNTYIMPALGELRCRTARRFLARYVRMSELEVRRFGPPQYEAATRALLNQRLTWDQIADLLRNPNSAVRGTALLECLDNRTEERDLALRKAAPWVLSLPRARR
jgi:glycerophosphoryl diester phosphodiesterase